ncbi:MAG: acetyl-CoA C-acyltransferase [Gemmatimonadota bacterium]|nr:acetyl-CoA C-acyltransferase [Gemmatimonadota bacterium]MDH3366783.1 acetyl-CoA C-acyltransferase [Gemmatimonadota bacterium]MDH3476915.1 acetyl-CoA C-acyltransferase [Gemmatimonadota bacterium]MDH3568598.1 acetyl-CoA C-acyltransferase [Gemmatimonadota bacterium]MDH5548281.1 acetyl-CoA C-acyltransferase [Gemmatimonadota bacterium]
MSQTANGRRVAVVAGCRSPFSRAGTDLKDVSAVDLARHTVVELVHRAGLRGAEVDEVYFGQVVASPLVPNIAREVSLLPQFPASIPAATVNRACASSNSAIVMGHDQIRLGHSDVVIAGGAENLSDIPILHSKRFSEILVGLSKAKTVNDRVKLLSGFRPKDLVPVSPAIAEPSTGESMGESAEKMAKLNGISRQAQDDFAVRSHRLAHAGTEDGRLTAEIAPFFADGHAEPITRDNGVRPDTSVEQVAKLKPVFDRRYGSVTAANSSPLTDGAAAVVLMADETARALGHEPLAYIRSYAVAALDPGDQLLMGPAYAVPKALERAGIGWKDLGLVEMHEAFAAQVLSNIQALESKQWAVEKLGRSEAVGEVNWETLNVMGGSIALGHPFGATGARITLTLASEMTRRDAQFGLISVCAQGGMGFAMVLERR